jgi:hypothetical protein
LTTPCGCPFLEEVRLELITVNGISMNKNSPELAKRREVAGLMIPCRCIGLANINES